MNLSRSYGNIMLSACKGEIAVDFTVKSMNEWLYPDDIITNAVPEAGRTALSLPLRQTEKG